MKKLSPKEISIVGMSVSLISVISQFSVPLPFGIPLTFQCFTVTLISVILGFKKSIFTILTYIIIGFIGIPVFSNFKAGPSALFGPTGGFIWGFIPMCAITGYISQKYNSKILLIISVYLGLALDYVIGVIQLSFVSNISLSLAIQKGAAPFLLKDIILCTLGILLAKKIKKLTKLF